jgi:hypothetical protein
VRDSVSSIAASRKAPGGRDVRRVEDRLHLLEGQHAGERAGAAGRGNILRRIDAGDPGGQQVRVEPPDGHERARGGARRKPFLVQPREEHRDEIRRGPGGIGPAGGQEAPVAREVPAVGLQRVAGEPALDRGVVHEGVDLRVDP